MKEIIINEKNTERITKAIEAAEGLATVRLLTMRDIFSSIEETEKYFKSIPKTTWEGLEICVDSSAQSFPKAYKYTPMSTQFVMTYKSRKWRLTWLGRDICTPTKWEITMPEKMKDDILKKVSSHEF